MLCAVSCCYFRRRVDQQVSTVSRALPSINHKMAGANTTTYPQYLNDLDTLDLSNEDFITLAVVTKKYKSLSLLLHPDKNPQNVQKHTDLFQELNSSYRRLFDHIHKNIDKTQIDGEELNLYEYYNLHNIVKENRNSVTVTIENSRAKQWETTMTSLFGPATINKDRTGKIWQVHNYQNSDQKVTITLYIRPKSDNLSKLHIQSGASYDKVFSTLELPVIYQKVLLEVPTNEAAAPVIQIEHPQNVEEIVDLFTSETVPSSSSVIVHSQPVAEIADLVSQPIEVSPEILSTLATQPPSPASSVISTPSSTLSAALLSSALEKVESLISSQSSILSISSPVSTPGSTTPVPTTGKTPSPPTSAPSSSSAALSTYFQDSQESFLDEQKSQEDTIAVTTPENVGFHCAKCNSTHNSNCELSTHVQNAHYLEGKTESTKFPCNQCQSNFKTTSQLIDHSLSLHHKELFTCNMCGLATDHTSVLQSHIATMHGRVHEENTGFQCEEGDVVTNTISELLKHVRNRHNRLHCEQCNTTFKNTNDLVEHILATHHADLHKCNTCGLVTANTNVLQNHILTSHVPQHLPEPTPVNTEEILKALKNEVKEGIKEQLNTQLEEIQRTFQQNVNYKNTVAKNNESPIETSYRPTLETMSKNESTSVTIDIPEDVIEENTDIDIPEDVIEENTDPNTDYPGPNTDTMNAGVTSNENKSLQDQSKEEKKTSRMKGLWIADSIGSFINKEALEESTNSDITFKKAYTAAYDMKAHSPDKNFTEVTNRALANEHFDWIGLQGGACDISNLDLSENVEVLKQQAFISASNMFSLSLKIVNANPTTNVFLMKRTPRVDTNHEDPNGLKSQLSQYADSIYQQLWIEHGCSPQIIIGDHFIFNCRGENKDKLFGQPNTSNYDGVHFRTNFGKQQYTRSVLLTFKRCWPDWIKVPKMQKLLNQPPHPTPTSSPSPPPTSSSPFPALASTQLPDTSRPPPQRRGYVTKEGTYKKNPFTWSKVAGQKHRRFVPQPPQVPLQNQYQALADY